MPKVSHYKSIYFLIYAHPRYMICLFMNIQKQLILLKSSLLFKKNTNFRILEFSELEMRNFQGIVFTWTLTYSEIFQSALEYLQ